MPEYISKGGVWGPKVEPVVEKVVEVKKVEVVKPVTKSKVKKLTR